MNKKYIDFVPTKNKATETGEVAARVANSRENVSREVIISRKIATSKRGMPVLKRNAVASKSDSKKILTKAPVRRSSTQMIETEQFAKVEDGLGVIENLGVVNENIAEKPAEKLLGGDEKTFKVPKNPFINQGKIEKRPLSKNVYQKKIVVPEEKPKGPVTIIAKPEKDAHVSLIVAVILTIILGAAAGTVAFLLLPK